MGRLARDGNFVALAGCRPTGKRAIGMKRVYRNESLLTVNHLKNVLEQDLDDIAASLR